MHSLSGLAPCRRDGPDQFVDHVVYGLCRAPPGACAATDGRALASSWLSRRCIPGLGCILLASRDSAGSGTGRWWWCMVRPRRPRHGPWLVGNAGLALNLSLRRKKQPRSVSPQKQCAQCGGRNDPSSRTCGCCASPVVPGVGHGRSNRTAGVVAIAAACIGLLMLLALVKLLVV
jgi:hypothetical protein